MNKDRELEEKKYPCVDCGKLRTAGEGGTTFTVCDECWRKAHPKPNIEKLESEQYGVGASFHNFNGNQMCPKINEIIDYINTRR